MIVLTFTPGEAARIVAGEQIVVTYPADLRLTEQLLTPLVVGQTVAIARLPVVTPCDNCGEVDEHVCHLDGEVYGPYTVPAAIVGSARVADVVPVIIDPGEYPPDAAVIESSEGVLLHWPHGATDADETDDLADQLPFADFTPGRWAVILTDAKPCEERCVLCGGAMNEQTPRGRQGCDSDGTPIPYDATGPIGEWTP